MAGNQNSGARPLPTALHEVRGTFRPDRHGNNGHEPKPKLATTAMPRWAGLKGEAEKCWKRLAPQLIETRVLTEDDITALVALCRRWAEWDRLRQAVERDGETYWAEGTHGGGAQLKPNPAVNMRDNAFKDVMRALTEFGLTPSSRARVRVSGASEPEDVFGKLLAKRGGKQGA